VRAPARAAGSIFRPLRRACLIEGESIRGIARRLGVSRQVVRRAIASEMGEFRYERSVHRRDMRRGSGSKARTAVLLLVIPERAQRVSGTQGNGHLLSAAMNPGYGVEAPFRGDRLASAHAPLARNVDRQELHA
jgi:ribosomal protein S14